MKYKVLKKIRLEFKSSATIEDVAEEAVRVKDQTGLPVSFRHRCVDVLVGLEDTPASVVEGYLGFEQEYRLVLPYLRKGY